MSEIQNPLPCVYLRKDTLWVGYYYVGQAKDLWKRYQGLRAKRSKNMTWDKFLFYVVEPDEETRLKREREFTEFCWAFGLPLTNTHYIGSKHPDIHEKQLWRVCL